jgi:hypothetical protein
MGPAPYLRGRERAMPSLCRANADVSTCQNADGQLGLLRGVVGIIGDLLAFTRSKAWPVGRIANNQHAAPVLVCVFSHHFGI